MPIPSTCKEVSKNQSLIYNPSLGYKRKDKAFVEKLLKNYLKKVVLLGQSIMAFPLTFLGK